MEIWRILLIILVVVLLLAFSYTYYSTLKFRTIADRQAFEKAPKVIDQTQNSYSMMPSQFMKRPSHHQKDFIDTFIELSKEPSSSTALASTAAVIDKPKTREEGEPASKTDRSIDFLLATTTTRRGYTRRNERAANNADHTQLDISYTKPKGEPEKASYDIREDIEKIEKEVASISSINLFKTHLWKEFLHYHYILALALPKQRKKPLRHHILYNSALYMLVLYIMSFLATELGPNSLKDFSLIAVGCVILAVLLLPVIYSIHNTEDNCLASELLPEERGGEDPVEERTNALLIISQKRFTQEVVSKLICILGFAAGISMFSRMSKLDALSSQPLFGGFMVVVTLDIAVVRNILIVVLTGSLGSVIRKRMVKERVRQLVERRAIHSSLAHGNEANKKLFTIQQDVKENYASADHHEIQSFRKIWDKKGSLNQETNRITFENQMTGSNEETEDRRNRIMSFSDKDRPENRVNTVHSEAHTEDIISRHRDSPKEAAQNLNSSFAMSPANKQKNEQAIANQPSGSKANQSSASKAAKFSIFIPPHEFLTKRAFSPKKDHKNIDTSIMKLDGTHHLEEDKSSDNRIQSIDTISKGMDTDKLNYEEIESKDNTPVNKTHHTHFTHHTPHQTHQTLHTEAESEHINLQAINEEEVPEEQIEETPEEDIVQNEQVTHKSGLQQMPAEFLDQLEAEIDESIEKKRTLNKQEPLPVKEEEHKEPERPDYIPLTGYVDVAPKVTEAESIKAASIASAKKALANFKSDWFESLSTERKNIKDDVIIPNPIVNEELNKEEEPKHVEQHLNKEHKHPSADTSLSLPYSLAYLDEKSQPNIGYDPERNSTLRRMIGRKESIMSQEEFRYEVENFMKHFPKSGMRRRNNNVSDSENDVELSRNDFNLSIREESERRLPGTWKDPSRENKFVLQEREYNMPSPKRNAHIEVESYGDIKDDIKGAEWLGYDTQLGKKKQKHANKALPSYEERKSKMLQEELERSRRKKKGNSQSRGSLMPTFNLDKLSEVSRSYGFKIQQKGAGTSNQDIIISKLDQKRKSTSVDRPAEELLEHQKLPRVTRSSMRSHRRVSIEDRREVKSLNKLASLPEIKEHAHAPKPY